MNSEKLKELVDLSQLVTDDPGSRVQVLTALLIHDGLTTIGRRLVSDPEPGKKLVSGVVVGQDSRIDDLLKQVKKFSKSTLRAAGIQRGINSTCSNALADHEKKIEENRIAVARCHSTEFKHAGMLGNLENRLKGLENSVANSRAKTHSKTEKGATDGENTTTPDAG